MTPERVLYTDKDGKPVSLEDLIEEGLEVDHSGRVPWLLDLLAHGAPGEQLLSCVVLTSWGVEAGFEERLREPREGVIDAEMAIEADRSALPGDGLGRVAVVGAPPEPFDMATQAAALIGPLAMHDDEQAARHAERLMRQAPNATRALRELADALRYGRDATLDVLNELARSPSSSVREEAQRSLAARQARSG